MTGREKLEAVFRGEMAEAVPFALKGWRVPSCTLERELRNRGMAILDSRSVCACRCPNVKESVTTETVNGLVRTTTVYETPRGTLSCAMERQPSAPRTEQTAWHAEFMFKTEPDYDPIEFMIRDTQAVATYESYTRGLDKAGTDAAFKSSAPGAAIHVLMYQIMGIETFSMEMADRPERVMALHKALVEQHRRIYEVVAKGPADIIQFGGNYAPEVLGKPRFLEFVVPHWQEVCDLFHEEKKLVGAHLDANNKLWAKEIGESGLDWIEAFSPSPDTDMTVAEARAAWPGKILFTNFPSAVHLAEPAVIRDATLQILKDSAPGDRFIIGITENVPDDRWRVSFPIILDTCNEFGCLPISA